MSIFRLEIIYCFCLYNAKSRIMDRNFTLKHFIQTFLVEGLNYLKYSFILPAIILYAFLFFAIIIGIQELFLSGSWESILNKIPWINIASIEPNKTIDIGIKEIIGAYGWLTIISYIIGSALRRFSKIKINLSYKKKSIIILSTIFIGYAFVLSSVYFRMKDPLNLWLYFTFFGFAILTIIASVLALNISRIVNKLIFYINKIFEDQQ